MDKQIVWKDIEDYEGFYQISSTGVVKSLKRDIIRKDGTVLHVKQKIKKLKTRRGYKKVCLHKNGDRKTFFVHQLVARAFIGNPPTVEHEINHKDGNPANNHVDNLEWVTHSENMKHAVRELGLKPPTRKGAYKISDEDVAKMRSEYVPYRITSTKLAKKYGISKHYAIKILTREVRA